VVEQDVKDWRREPPPRAGKKGQDPTLEQLYNRIVPQLLKVVTSDSLWTSSTFKRWGKDAARLAGYTSLKAFVKAIPH
jgi:hypothetical protein